MQVPKIPSDEKQRLQALRAMNILDTPPEERFDRLTRLAKRLLGVPIAVVSLVDENRQWFKSAQGLDATETPRDVSFCGHALNMDDVFLVPDAAADTRFFDNPLVTGDPHIRFYAGVLLRVPNGSKIGTLCVIDREPRELSEEDLDVLRDLAYMTEQELGAIQLATMDQLTDISNRRGFESLSKHALALCRRVGRPASLVYFDMDGFKEINDTYGHAEGDRALVAFAELLRDCFRESDVLGRLGGDEFAVLLTNTPEENCDGLLQRFAEQVDAYSRSSRRGYDLRFSSGVIGFDEARHSSLSDLMADADRLMYHDKQSRKEDRDSEPSAATGN